jgi:acetyl esterase/lipase
MIEAMAASGFALPDPLEATAMRALMDNPFPTAPIEVAEVRDVEVDGAAGPIAARLYHPRPGETLPVAVLFHGGGWVVGTLDTHDGLARVLARDAGCAVLSVAYRLAPEHRFPAPVDDCIAAVKGLPARAAGFGIDAGRLALVGDSAGGNLAAAAALALRGGAVAPPRAGAVLPGDRQRLHDAVLPRQCRGRPADQRDDGLLLGCLSRRGRPARAGDADPRRRPDGRRPGDDRPRRQRSAP